MASQQHKQTSSPQQDSNSTPKEQPQEGQQQALRQKAGQQTEAPQEESRSSRPSPIASILVPVYNAQDYLSQCLDSLVGQTLSDIEIICVDDGSTDESPHILARYAERDQRIRVITKRNTGYGDSMNKALAEAYGAWIGVCEPDDFCSPGMYELLVSAGEAACVDMVKGPYLEHSDGVDRPSADGLITCFPTETPLEAAGEPRLLLISPTIWTGLYRRSMLEGAHVRFSPTPGASFQDLSFAHQCWMASQSVLLLGDALYHYRTDNAASSSKSADKIFAVCGEYERSEAFLQTLPEERQAAFAPWLNVARMGNYLWNYNRIDPNQHLCFAQRWAADMARARETGTLDESLLSPGYRNLLHELADPHVFCEHYADSIPVPDLIDLDSLRRPQPNKPSSHWQRLFFWR